MKVIFRYKSKFLFLVIIVCTLTVKASGKNDSIYFHSPKAATIKSAIIPGRGQLYNKKYWKIPILYAGFSALGYFTNFNLSKYMTFKNAYILRIDNDSLTKDIFDVENIESTEKYYYTTTQLKSLRDDYRRQLELTYILTAGLYVLNIIDACVDAHLFEFDLGEDLSLDVYPVLLYSSNTKFSGIEFKIIF